MINNVLSTLSDLFASTKPSREPVHFAWWLVCRKKRPFLLLPARLGRVSTGLELYSAQRPLARLWRSLMPLVLRTPLAKVYYRVAIQADATSDLMRFLVEQAGLPAGQLQTPAIKFGGIAEKTSRVVLLVRDASGHPRRVIKVGLTPQGRASTDREADLLSRLPKDVIGCTSITGKFASADLSAFATAYFPGNSLDNDVGIEKLFHNWLRDLPPEPISNLASWRELESVAVQATPAHWPALRAALADQLVRPTLFQGDFTPWNVRMINLDHIRAFDWERGHLKGIPGWDWLHFIVQTSILVKRYSPARVAAELEQLIRSPRFQTYAAEAGISPCIEPLLLAYLLHQKLVVRPLEGSAIADRLFQLLWTQWRLKTSPDAPALLVPATLRQPAFEQIQTALAKLANLFWEPSLSPITRPSLPQQIRRHWLGLLAAGLWIGAVATLHFFTSPLLLFAPFYLAPCLVLALKTDERLASLAALVAGCAGPLQQFFRASELAPVDVTCWNLAMRMLIFQVVVLLLARTRKLCLGQPPHQELARPTAIQALTGNWAVLLVTGVYFALVILLDLLTDPHLTFLPFYVLPCVILTLASGWRLGSIAALAAAVSGPLLQRFEAPYYRPVTIVFWNIVMRLVIFQTVVLLLDRLRRESILFQAGKTN